MANPCRTHTHFKGDLCPVCLMEERDRLREQRDHLRAACISITQMDREAEYVTMPTTKELLVRHAIMIQIAREALLALALGIDFGTDEEVIR